MKNLSALPITSTRPRQNPPTLKGPVVIECPSCLCEFVAFFPPPYVSSLLACPHCRIEIEFQGEEIGKR